MIRVEHRNGLMDRLSRMVKYHHLRKHFHLVGNSRPRFLVILGKGKKGDKNLIR